MAFLERIHEFGILQALWMRPRTLAFMTFAESVLLTLIGIVAGLALGIPIGSLTSAGTTWAPSSDLTPSALISLSGTTLWNLGDSSFREFFTVGWSMSDNLDLQLGMNIGFGGIGAEFGGFSKDQAGVDFETPNLYFAFCTFYF